MTHPYVLHNTFGADFIGLIVASTLYGVSIVQTWYYYGHHNDNWPLKSLVGVVMTFDTVHQALVTHTVYTQSITSWGNAEQLNEVVRTGLVGVLFIGLVAFLVQGFLTLRVWRLTNGNIWLTGIAALLTLAELACLIAYYAMSDGVSTFTQLTKLNGFSIAANLLAAVADSFIAAVLCILLHRSRTGFERSNTIINKLIIFALNTGALTSLCAVALLISIVVAGNTFIYVGFYFCLCRLYTNTLLATLNARKMILKAGGSNAIDNLTVSLENQEIRGPHTSIQINIKTETNDQNNDMDKTESGSPNAQKIQGKRASFEHCPQLPNVTC